MSKNPRQSRKVAKKMTRAAMKAAVFPATAAMKAVGKTVPITGTGKIRNPGPLTKRAGQTANFVRRMRAKKVKGRGKRK